MYICIYIIVVVVAAGLFLYFISCWHLYWYDINDIKYMKTIIFILSVLVPLLAIRGTFCNHYKNFAQSIFIHVY